MDYESFKGAIVQYQNLYDTGLKKQANAFMRELVQQVQDLPSDEAREELLARLCWEIMTSEHPILRKNHHSRVPYGLEQLMEDAVRKRSAKEGMPWLRWYFELFQYSPPYAKDAYAALRQAIDSGEADKKAVDLFFDELLDDLQYGHHHFTDGCIFPVDVYHDLIREGEDLIERFPIDRVRIERFAYHKKLYECWDAWLAVGKQGSFSDLCSGMGVPFEASGAYYY